VYTIYIYTFIYILTQAHTYSTHLL